MPAVPQGSCPRNRFSDPMRLPREGPVTSGGEGTHVPKGHFLCRGQHRTCSILESHGNARRIFPRFCQGNRQIAALGIHPPQLGSTTWREVIHPHRALYLLCGPRPSLQLSKPRSCRPPAPSSLLEEAAFKLCCPGAVPEASSSSLSICLREGERKAPVWLHPPPILKISFRQEQELSYHPNFLPQGQTGLFTAHCGVGTC